MNLCIPVLQDLGLASPISGHFGHAPVFLLVDVGNRSTRAIANGHAHHAHGQCSPLASLAGEQLEAMIVSGIGPGAVNHLNAAGIPVFVTGGATVAEALAELDAGTLRRITPAQMCGHHGHGHDHGHAH